MANLVETILSSLPANAGDALGDALGDDAGGSMKAVSAILPLLLSAFAGKAAAGADLGGLTSMISGALAGGNPLDNPAALLTADHGSSGIGGLAQQLLGAGAGPAVAAVAALFGLKGNSVNALMSLAGPLLAGGIGKVMGPTPSVPALRSMLVSEKASYEEALPPELRRLIAPVEAPRPAAPEPERKSSGLLVWLLLGLGLLGLLWYLFGRGHKEETVVAAPAVEAVAPPAVVEPAPVPAGAGVIAEDRVGKPALVVFFAVGESAVTNDLAGESGSLKAYVDANPASRVSVSGYNDPTGDAAANAELSKNRAEQVKAALVAAGFPADRIDLDKPVAPTDTSDSYAAARRVEVTVKD